MAKYTATKEYTGAYRFSDQSIASLADTMREYCGVVPKVNVTFNNGHEIELDSVIQWGGDALFRAEEITRVRISAYAADKRARVVLGWLTAAATVEFEGEQGECVAALHRVNNEVSGAQTWYGALYRYENWIFGFLAAINAVALGLLLSYKDQPPTTLSVLAAVPGALLLLGFLSRRFLLRRVEFLVGRGNVLSKRRTAALSFIVVFVVLGIGIGVVGNFVFAALTRFG